MVVVLLLVIHACCCHTRLNVNRVLSLVVMAMVTVINDSTSTINFTFGDQQRVQFRGADGTKMKRTAMHFGVCRGGCVTGSSEMLIGSIPSRANLGDQKCGDYGNLSNEVKSANHENF